MSIQQDPAYHDGFFDYLDGEPLFERDCSPTYAAGWHAAHECQAFFAREIEAWPAASAAKLPAHFQRRYDA
jgi:hypothetical protein